MKINLSPTFKNLSSAAILFSCVYCNIISAQFSVNLGYLAGEFSSGTGNIFIGNEAGKNHSGSNLLIISNDSLLSTIYGDLEHRRVAIGTEDFPTDSSYRLAVEGKVIAREFKATQTMPWPDYVFDPTYSLPSLDSLQLFINQYGHLPEIPSAASVEKEGIELAFLNSLLLKKIEELTLYMLDQQRKIDDISGLVKSLQLKLESLKSDKE